MTSKFWPLGRLRLRTPRLELRWPGEADLEALAEVAAGGINDPARHPFIVDWTNASPAERARSVLQYQWRVHGRWTPADWCLGLAVVRAGELVGLQSVSGRDFAIRRVTETGSWLGRAYQGQGIGTEMRAAVLHLAFAGLGARYAESSAFTDNPASLTVSRKLGYRDDGVDIYAVRDQPAVSQRLRLDRVTWEQAHSVPVEIDGLEPCLADFGLPDPEPAD